ncbi:relaxase/mobilization nuclease domain-containing protein [Mucilaginibacter galii]|uniref:MobA/VirD2-like nuclease domain-containing protein n=1 Tax=Mucilaginibacter galii TaxID=2005073 RepID=A0A917J9J5_9SPHI|nr:relaxase/mobilization nuclease domain-containing protein [Mucilaginibacter galii]GGI50445.1 hypothetical protein GCM10011425_16570 [Mucilaginibacter galii]
MIALQKIGKSFMGALKYNWNKLAYPDRNIRAVLLSTNFTSLDLGFIKQEVDLIKSLRPSLGRYVYHTSLNFSKEDVLDNKTMLAIAEDYLMLSGYSNNQYFIFRHHDADHPHLHLLVNRITFDGEVVSDSNNYKKSEAILRKLEQQCNLVTVEQSNHLSKEQNKAVSKYASSGVPIEQLNKIRSVRSNNRSMSPGKRVTLERGSNVSAKPYIKTPLRAPTKSELEMVYRTGEASAKMELQERILRLVSGPGISLQKFINKCEAEGIHLLFNQASTGRVSGITYFYGDLKIKGQKLGNRFKWAELIKSLDYEQGRDSKAISQASERTRAIYGDYTTGLLHTTGGLGSTAAVTAPDAGQLLQPTGIVEADERYAEQTSAAAYGHGAGNHPSGQDAPSGANVDKNAGGYGDWRDHAGVGYIPGIEISDDIDDEAILGRNRRRQKKARTNTR